MKKTFPASRYARLVAVLAVVPTMSAQTIQMDWIAPSGETTVDTDSTMLVPVGSPPVTIQNGVFLFRNVTIPAGARVIGKGSQPMIWLVTGRFTVGGELRLDGGDGHVVYTINSANFPTPGGAGVCSGGDGGRGSPDALDRSPAGEAGYDAFQLPGIGGVAGNLSCDIVSTGSGGGGGRFISVAGDPRFRTSPMFPQTFPQMFGIGGTSPRSTLAPSAPGRSPFSNSSSDDDFHGVGFDLFHRRVVVGELAKIRGGQGGGGGGDRARSCQLGDPLFFQDEKGGGGGGGGGALVILALDRIVLLPTGRISADGGDGGGGEQAGSNNRGGGGGGGSGGLVILGAATRIELHTHAGLYADGDTDFAVTADGGIGRQGAFESPPIEGKYSPNAPPTAPRNVNYATGGFGGMGIVQLMAPIGSNSDGTNTIFDDSIDVIRNGTVLGGASKSAYLAWRGWENAVGQRVDDNGAVITVPGDGDIRPAPILLPMF